VRVVTLSDHVGDLLKQSQRQAVSDQQRAAASLSTATRQHQAKVRQAETVRDQARAARHLLAWLRATLAVRRLRRQAPAQSRATQPLSNEESKLQAGLAGEEFVATELGRQLKDDWVLLRGYHNKRGEIDQLLLGPRGLVAIEVKNINGTVHCDGDRWRIDKYDRYGNLVEQSQVLDHGQRRRSPSEQLNEPADLLTEFLRSRGLPVEILRVVLLTHQRAKIGTSHGATVNVYTDTAEVLNLMRKVPQPLDAATRTRIEELIVKNHQRSAARRPR
jgi:nuclease-like protein